MSGFDLSNMSGAPSFTGGAGGDAVAKQTASSMFDSSGWTVATGHGSATGAPSPLVSNPWMIGGLIMAGLIAWKLYLGK